MKCKICASESKSIFNAKILNKYDINYYHCSNCGFLQTEDPYWLNEAYEESINLSDTGIMKRNLHLSKIASIVIFFFFKHNEKFVDFAGGYGIFTRLMRDIGFDFYWHDLYTTNLLARGFEYKSFENEKIELITSFESFEHFVDPIEEIENMLAISKSILFSTQILPVQTPSPHDWWYYGLEHGQHISFYEIRTLKYIADKYKLNFLTNGRNIHLLTDKDINPFLFKALLESYRVRMENIIPLMLKSRTVDDMNFIIERGEE